MKIVLCETSPTKTTYTFLAFGVKISSYEELCYVIQNYLIYFFVYGIPKDLLLWIEKEFELSLEGMEVKKQLKQLMEYRNFFTRQEKQMLSEQMRMIYVLSPTRKHRQLADLFLEQKKYLSAYHNFQKVFVGIGQYKKEEQQQIYYHTGLCLAKMFRYDEATHYFLQAISLGNHEKSISGYMMIAYLKGDLHQVMEAGRKIGLSDDGSKQWYDKMREKEEKVKKEDEFVKCGKIDYHRKKQDDITTKRFIKSMTEWWKNEYKEQIIEG